MRKEIGASGHGRSSVEPKGGVGSARGRRDQPRLPAMLVFLLRQAYTWTDEDRQSLGACTK